MAEKIKWEDANFNWNDAPLDKGASRYTWDDVTLVEEALKSLGGAGASPGAADDFIHPFFDKDPENKNEYMMIGHNISESRIMARAHFVSDRKYGDMLGDELYKAMKK